MKKIIWFLLLSVFSVGFIFPETKRILVRGATPACWNPPFFWYYRWSRSGIHLSVKRFTNFGLALQIPIAGLIKRAAKTVGIYLRLISNLKMVCVSRQDMLEHWLVVASGINLTGYSGYTAENFAVSQIKYLSN